VGDDVTVVSALEDGRVVAVEQGNLLGTSFHPEMTGDTRFHEYFLNRVESTGFRSNDR
jgi:5'-phosphate synthase pdxT subunit